MYQKYQNLPWKESSIVETRVSLDQEIGGTTATLHLHLAVCLTKTLKSKGWSAMKVTPAEGDSVTSSVLVKAVETLKFLTAPGGASMISEPSEAHMACLFLAVVSGVHSPIR